MLVVEVPVGDAGDAAATQLGLAYLRSDQAREQDLRLAAPEGDRWTVSEVDVTIAGPAALIPVERNVIVVLSADRMDRSTSEHLLKVVEEPSAPTTFVFVTARAGALLPTLRGRAGVILRLELASASQRAAALVASGADRFLATEFVGLAGPFGVLATAALATSEVGDDLRSVFASPVVVAQPCTTAAALVAALTRLAVIPVTPDAAKLAPPQLRARVRAMSRSLLHTWHTQVALDLVSPALTSATMRSARSALVALDAAEEDLAAYTSPVYVFAGLLATISAAQPPQR